jgi:DNA end-binding protein Ku
MRPVWKGHISFGLVNVPVTLYPAEQRADLSLRLIDSRDMSRVRYERVNAETGEEVPWDRVVKGYEYDDGNYVVIGQDELKQAAPEATQTVEIERFVDLGEIDPVYFDKPYFLEPGKKASKGYALLRDALSETGKAGIAKVVIRTRQYIAALVARGDGLVLDLLRYDQELREMDRLDLPGNADEEGVKKQEMKMARDLVESMAGPWDPSEYHDEYREKLQAWIEEKIESGEVERAPETSPGGEEAPEPINMMEALRKSLGRDAGGKKKSKARSKKKKTRKAG